MGCRGLSCGAAVMEEQGWYSLTADGLHVRVKVQPGAGVNRVRGVHGGELVVKIRAAPEKGKANRELIGFLAKLTGTVKRDVVILTGEHGRHKTVRLPLWALNALQRVAAG